MTRRKINILGATGSVGQSAADVIAAHPDKFEVGVISAHTNAKKLQGTAERLNAETTVLTGDGINELLDVLKKPVDITLAAISGMAGLKPLMVAIPHSKAVAIANKEPLVAAGDLVKAEAAKHGTKILPVDSEHNALFQVFEEENRDSVERLILTASGGPFRTWSSKAMENVTPAQAVKHPNWSMGQKISVDSATMMNKALEIIEAHYLFNMPADNIEVLVHPQSVIHSMVEYNDGSILAQLGAPDMKTPIINALAWPERLETPGERLDFKTLSQLDFEEPDFERFPALRVGYECLRAGPAACLILNAANEIAVDAFLEERISFPQIIPLCEDVLAQGLQSPMTTLEEILDFDENVRKLAKSIIVEKYNS